MDGKDPNDSLLNMAVNLRDAPIFQRWDDIIGYSTAFDNIARLSSSVRKHLCRPSQYFYFKDGLSDTMLAVRGQRVEATGDDVKILRRLYRDFIKGEYSKFINET